MIVLEMFVFWTGPPNTHVHYLLFSLLVHVLLIPNKHWAHLPCISTVSLAYTGLFSNQPRVFDFNGFLLGPSSLHK